MIPSKSPYSSGWSSTFTASRLSFMSYDGPFGTAHDRSTPSISSRRSKWSCRAACLCTTNNRPRTVDIVPTGSGELSGDRLARYVARLSVAPGAWASSSARSAISVLNSQPGVDDAPLERRPHVGCPSVGSARHAAHDRIELGLTHAVQILAVHEDDDASEL